MSDIVYNKLVRDNIPQIVQADGHQPVTRVLNDEEFKQALLAKLREEVEELIQDISLGERADVAEVLKYLDEALGFTQEEIETVRTEKAAKRGGFTERIFLEKVIENE